MPNIAFIGLGSMGKPMCSNLLAAGWPVAVFNRTASKAQGLAGNLRVAQSPADAAKGAEMVITMLADDAAVEEVTLGPQGFLPVLAEGAVHISMSTISLATVRRLAAAHASAGRGYLAAPVFGRPDAAAAGKLNVVTAGPKDLLERCRPVLEKIGQPPFHVGDSPEMANVVKLAGNFTIAAVLEALGEAMTLVRKCGVPPAQFLEILNGALFKSPIYQNYGGLIAEEKFEPAGFKMRLGLKDLGLVLAAAAEKQVPMPGAGVVYTHLLSGVARGMGDRDWSGVAGVIAENAGMDDSAQPAR